MNVFITYDVTAKQPQVKAEMLALGYFDHWTDNGTTWNLPNTSLWKPSLNSLKQALTDMNNIIAQINKTNFGEKVVLTRCIVLQSVPYDGIPGSANRS